MSFEVFLTADAIRDIEELYQYIARHDVPGKAQNVLTKIEEKFKSLSGTWRLSERTAGLGHTRISRSLFQTLQINLPDYRTQSLRFVDC